MKKLLFIMVLSLIFVGCGKKEIIKEKMEISDEEIEKMSDEDINDLAEIVETIEEESKSEEEISSVDILEEAEGHIFSSSEIELFDNAPIIDSDLPSFHSEADLIAAYGTPNTKEDSYVVYFLLNQEEYPSVKAMLHLNELNNEYDYHINDINTYLLFTDEFTISYDKIEKYIDIEKKKLSEDYDAVTEMEQFTYDDFVEIVGNSGLLAMYVPREQFSAYDVYWKFNYEEQDYFIRLNFERDEAHNNDRIINIDYAVIGNLINW